MNPRERALAALSHRPVDRAPVFYVAAAASVALQHETGCRMPAIHHDAHGMVELAWANHTKLGFDAVSVLINYFSMPAALGIAMDWGTPDRYPRCTAPLWERLDGAALPDNLLEREPIPTNLAAIHLATQRYGDEVAILGKVMGPLSMVQVTRGVDAMMMDLLDRPAAAQAALETCAEALAAYANAQLAAGADAISIGEGGAGGSMISPGMHHRHLLPVHRTMVAAIQGPTIMHICGDITPRLPLLCETGLDWFNFDWEVAPERIASEAAGRIGLMGNVNTTDLLMGEPVEVHRQVGRCLDAGIQIISPGCALSPNCPPGNLRAMADAVASWPRHGRGSSDRCR